jgi:hypothetical protein
MDQYATPSISDHDIGIGEVAAMLVDILKASAWRRNPDKNPTDGCSADIAPRGDWTLWPRVIIC